MKYALQTLLILMAAVLAGELMYRNNFGAQNVIMFHLLAVVLISAVTPTYVYGVLAALSSVLIYDFLVTEPRMNFSITRGLPVTLVIMLLVTVVVSAITAYVKASATTARDRERRVQQMYEINERLLAARSLEAIVALTGEYLTEHLNRPAILYTADPFSAGSLPSPVSEPPKDAEPLELLLYTPEQTRRVHRIFKIGEAETERPFDDSEYDVYNLPVANQNRVLGVIGVACKGTPIGHDDSALLKVLAGRVALALELQYLSNEQERVAVEAEREKIRSTLLRSISHDLRTPLTGILGASSAIMEQKDLDAETVMSLAGDIRLDAQWLIRMVENILIITRISGDNLKVRKMPEAAEEVVFETVALVRKRFPRHVFHTQIPDDLLMVEMDGTLISQVMINLLENAAKNSPEGSMIFVNLEKKEGCAVFEILDEGSGIPEHLLDALFDVHIAFGDQPPSAAQGMGLGLSICKTIVHAHGGGIEGHNRIKRGAKFSFRLPLQGAGETDE